MAGDRDGTGGFQLADDLINDLEAALHGFVLLIFLLQFLEERDDTVALGDGIVQLEPDARGVF